MNIVCNLNNEKKITLLFILFNFSIIWGQEYYFSNAINGLILREQPTTNSKRIGKLNYGTLVEIIEETNFTYTIIKKKDSIKSKWVKIKVNVFPFLDRVYKGYNWDKTGYVVKNYLEKLNKKYIKIETKEIDSLTFFKLYQEPSKNNFNKITSFEKVSKILSNRVKWKDNSMIESGKSIQNILLPTGQILDLDDEVIDFDFVAYYPSEEILLFEGGHSSDFSINIKTGETLNTVGNPEYIINSPTKKYRLNGWFPGQECSSYFFQEKKENDYTYLTDFGIGSNRFGKEICYLNKFCWITDNMFIYSYGSDYNIKKYIKSEIKTTHNNCHK